MSALLEDIARAVERTVNGSVTHRESVPVVETFNGETVWEGVVEVFDINGLPSKTMYGWAVEGETETQYITVMGAPPIDSPIAAVRAWLVSESKK